MAIQKKHAKARLDKYYYLAKEKGYRARAAFKLIQLNKKYSFLQQSKCLIDLCAAPGSWLQVAAETMPVKSLIIGVDLSPIKPIPRAITFQGDITTEKCRATIRGHLKSWKADTVIHDGAPNVGTAWVQDAFTQNELVLASLKLATEFLAPNGNFVTKVFRSKDSNKLEWIFKQLFDRVEQTKPPSSRNVSAETFYVCRGFKAPKHMDSRFLDPKYAFAEVEEVSVNNEARVFNPEKKKRKRDGYEEGDWTQFHEVPASEFIQTQDPIKMLGSLNRFHFRQEGNGDIALAALEKLPETTQEIRDCCADLKVLGRKEFKLLLRWRLKARERFGFRQKRQTTGNQENGDASTGDAGRVGEEVATLESMDEEMRLQHELTNMKTTQDKHKRKERRRENERKQKEIVRMQMNMTTPYEIGIEAAGPDGTDATFRLKDVDKAGIGREMHKGRMHSQHVPENGSNHIEMSGAPSDEEDEDEDGDTLERELDSLYEQYQERREDRDTKARAKRARKQARGDDDEFEGFVSDEDEEADLQASSDDEDLVEDEYDEDDEITESPAVHAHMEAGSGVLLTDLQSQRKEKNGLTHRAAAFFEQDLFKDIEGPEDSDEDSDVSAKTEHVPEVRAARQSEDSKASEAGFEESVRAESEEDWNEGTDRPPAEDDKGRVNVDIITAEAMTLAHALATGKMTKAQLLDDNFNKYSHRDTDGLPEWFLDDETKHSKVQRPVTAEAAKAIKEKLRALNARPIKKVREAKARKTFRAARRLEKLKKKSEGLIEGSDLSEKDKASSIAQLMSKAKKGTKKRQPVKVVKAGGVNKGGGRPRGVKGKYKMVDPRLKKDVRAEKRLAKKTKGRK